MRQDELALSLEAALFAAGEPLCVSETVRLLDLPKKQVAAALHQLREEYDAGNRGMRLNLFGDHAQLVTRESYAETVRLLTVPVVNQPLRQSVLETLAVVAYHQPVTRAEIDQTRGVKSDSSVKTLLELGLINEVGKRDSLGHPMQFGTTDKFLSHFGLAGLADLPNPNDDGKNEKNVPPEQTTFLDT